MLSFGVRVGALAVLLAFGCSAPGGIDGGATGGGATGGGAAGGGGATGGGAATGGGGASGGGTGGGASTGGGAASGGGGASDAGVLTPVFVSSFRAATGTTATALSDSGKWHVYGSSGVVLTNPQNLGFPANMPNILRVSWSTPTAIWRVGPPFGAGFPALATGSKRYYRYYFRQVQPNATMDTQTHPMQDGSGGSQTNWTMQCYNNVGADLWKLGHGFWGNPFPVDQFQLITLLNKHRTYRLEHSIERVSATTYRFDTRVFDESVSATTALYDGDDFYAAGDMARGSMTAYFANQTLTFNNAQNLDGLNAGVNDLEPTEPGDYAYESGFAVVDDQGWIGPYGSVAGEQ